MPVTHLEIVERSPYEGGREFGETGAYERIDAIAHYAVDPAHAANAGIIDLGLAERGDDGLVHFQGDMTLLRPVAPEAGNRALLMQVPNRGKRTLARLNMSPMDDGPSADVPPGDGFLFERGWTVGWAGWQWDVPRTPERTRIGLTPPLVPESARLPLGRMQLRIQPNVATDCFVLTDHHVGDLGHHTPVRARDAEDRGTVLLVRETPYGAATEIPRGEWRFAKLVDGVPQSDDEHIWLKGGFQPGLIYDILYTPLECPVVGAGMLATRDLTSFLRYDEASPVVGAIDQTIGEGQSQCGRFLRTYLHFEVNTDEAGRPALDGVLAHIAGGRRGEFNHRYGQPSVQPTPSFGHLFPFADLPQTDPLSGKTAGLLDAHRANGNLPKIFYTDTSAEYWRGDAGLSHTDLESDGDATLPDNVRRYLFASTQHGPGAATLVDRTLFGSVGQNYLNVIDYRPLYRAALTNLLAWVAEDEAPPASDYPRRSDGTRATRSELIPTLAEIPGLDTPEPAVMTRMYLFGLGPDAAQGIGVMPAEIASSAYPDYVSTLDPDGNEAAGVKMPDVAVPVATHTGFNPRHPETGGSGQLLEYVGSTIPFAPDAAARKAAGDPRPSIAERYADREDYLQKVRSAAQQSVRDGFLLEDDVPLCVEIAAARYDVCVAK